MVGFNQLTCKVVWHLIKESKMRQSSNASIKVIA